MKSVERERVRGVNVGCLLRGIHLITKVEEGKKVRETNDDTKKNFCLEEVTKERKKINVKMKI